MRSTLISTALAATLATVTLAAPAYAITLQNLVISFDPTPEDVFNGDETDARDQIDDRTGPIDRSILARLEDPNRRYLAQGSVGEFGNLGIFGNLGRVGGLSSQVSIESNDFQNLTGRPQQAEVRFIIDGGEFSMVAGEDSVIEFRMRIFKDTDVVYDTGFAFQSFFDPVLGHQNRLQTSGEDLGIGTIGSFGIGIPVVFATADLGIIEPLERFAISYVVDIAMTAIGFSEVMSFEFSDPFDVSGFGDFPEVSFSDAPRAVPLPATAPLIAAAIGALVFARRRRRC